VDLRHALEKSCNVYFYTVGNMLGVDKIHEWAKRLGLAGGSGIDLPNEVESLVPSTEWKKKRTGEKWYAGETISVAIGQGQVSVTPMSMAVMMASIANGQQRIVPRLVKAVDEGKGKGWEPIPAPPSPYPDFFLKPGTISAVHDGLWLAVNGAGTAVRARIAGRDVAGKTGTAQVISNQGRERARGAGSTRDLRDHGWFVFMVPRDKPVLAGAIFAEHAEHGYFAAPIAKHVIETYYAQQEGRPLPSLEPAPLTAPAGAAVSDDVWNPPPPPGVPAGPEEVPGRVQPAPAPAAPPAPVPARKTTAAGAAGGERH
jgi:penicillin-binding protein 2